MKQSSMKVRFDYNGIEIWDRVVVRLKQAGCRCSIRSIDIPYNNYEESVTQDYVMYREWVEPVWEITIHGAADD